LHRLALKIISFSRITYTITNALTRPPQPKFTHDLCFKKRLHLQREHRLEGYSVNDISDKLTTRAGANDTYDHFTAGVNDTGDSIYPPVAIDRNDQT
jgi:hypothetical protein